MSTSPPGFRLVIVDDNQSDLVLLQEAIAESGHPIEVITFSSAVQAMERLHDMPAVDLVLSDVNMPLIDGFDFMERLRSIAHLRSTAFVLMSSSIDQDLPITTRHRSDGIAYLRKGVTWNDYRAIVDTIHRRMVAARSAHGRQDPGADRTMITPG